MKILTRYIIREHIAPFLFAFFTITFLLVIDHVPRIIDHVIDKNLSIWIALELVGLNLAWMLALSIPMAVLVATLMAFGRLSSDFEITAVKASGINLIHVLMPLLVIGGLLSFGMVQFNDKVLPDLNQKARILWGDIASMRPTLIFRSGTFITDVPGYLILIDKIDHTTSRVEGVRITETKVPSTPRIIVADYGFLKTVDNGATTEFTLHNGELHSLDLSQPENYRKIDFETQVFNVTGTGSELQRSETEYRSDREMNIQELKENVDRATLSMAPNSEQIASFLRTRLTYLFADTFSYSFKDSLTDSAAYQIVKTDAAVMANQLQKSNDQIFAQSQVRNKYQIELYKKYSIPAATLAFILVGAPIGMLTRKGGMGIAIAISIGIFILYWAFLIGGEDIADRGLLSPFWAMWSANILLGVLGLYLIIKVVTERPIFSFFRKSNL
ncbi:MAG: LptF/LptG family permease [candidate division Zixibacteria bacterium]|nr:LptF/LptG family permease [candidate division Zixibacteria bacterium]